MEVLIWLWRKSVVTVCCNEVVIVKSLLNGRKHTCSYFKRCWAFVLFFAYCENIFMERTWIRPKVYLISREMGDVQVANWRKSTTDTIAACPKLKSLIRHLHIYNAPCLPPNFCISNLSNLYWDDYNTREKWKTKVMQNFGGQTRFIMGDVEMAASSHKHGLNDDRTTAPNWIHFSFPPFHMDIFSTCIFKVWPLKTT